MHPLPFSTAERAAGLAQGTRQLRYLSDDASDVTEADYRPLPALRTDVEPVIRIPPAAPAPGYVAERRTPLGPATIEGNFAVPALQAAFTALAVAVCAGLLAWVAGWGWRLPVAVGGLALVWGWFWRMKVSDGLRYVLETLTRTDLDGDGVVGAPALAFTVANPAQARAAVATETRQTAEDAQRTALLAFVDTCYTAGTPESAHGVKAGGSERDAYLHKRDVLLSLGIATWKNPDRHGSGWQMVVSRERAWQIVARHVL